MRPFPQILIFIFCTTVLLLIIFSFAVPSLTVPISTRTPSLFPKSAIITLTDDNSTFFLARPAAFGPELPEEDDTGRDPKRGLAGRLFVADEGELGCGDVTDGDDENDYPSGKDGRHILEAPWSTLRQRIVELYSRSPLSPQADSQISTLPELGDVSLDLLAKPLSVMDTHSRESDLPDMDGRILLISRGGCGFLEKVLWAQKRGAIAVIVGDNMGGRGLVTMYAKGKL